VPRDIGAWASVVDGNNLKEFIPNRSNAIGIGIIGVDRS